MAAVAATKPEDTPMPEFEITEEQHSSNDAQVPKTIVTEEKKDDDLSSAAPVLIERSASFKEESNLLSDLREYEKKALSDLRAKLQDAIVGNKLFQTVKPEETRVENPKNGDEDGILTSEDGETEKTQLANDEKEKTRIIDGEKTDQNVVIWGVSLLPSNEDKGLDIILLKFLRAREFSVSEAFQMLKNALRWRKENKIDSILDDDEYHEVDADLASVVYMNGVDREGHPICYNVYGKLRDEQLYGKVFGSEEKLEKLLKWRFQLMEKGIQKLDFNTGGVASLLQINDLKNSPGPSRRELRSATKRAVELLQDNYPELVAKNVFINVPFWYYAFNALLSPFLTARTKSKFVFARPSKSTDTLLRYIAAEQIPINYGGLKRENDPDFSIEDSVSEVFIKAGSTETIEIPMPDIGTSLLWDLSVPGWEVNYTEEYVPADEGSYTLLVSKVRKMGWQETSVRNSFKNKEPGKLVFTIENWGFKKKRVLYRYKFKN